jgi:putative DNA-invertase from lambdoid prophage Rac
MATVLYARVSTSEQTIAHQRTQAEEAGFVLDQVISDEGQSGVSTRLSERPEGRRLFDLLRAGDTLVVRWLDRLGRNYVDVTDAMREFLRRGVTIKTVINRQVFDASPKDPMAVAVRDALIGFMAALGEAQAQATKEARDAGIAYSQATYPERYKGRKPKYSEAQVLEVQRLMGEGKGATEVAGFVGLSRATVYRIMDNPAQAIASARAWH